MDWFCVICCLLNVFTETGFWIFAQPDVITTVVPYVNLIFGIVTLCRLIVLATQREGELSLFQLFVSVSLILQFGGNSLPVVVFSQVINPYSQIISCVSFGFFVAFTLRNLNECEFSLWFSLYHGLCALAQVSDIRTSFLFHVIGLSFLIITLVVVVGLVLLALFSLHVLALFWFILFLPFIVFTRLFRECSRRTPEDSECEKQGKGKKRQRNGRRWYLEE